MSKELEYIQRHIDIVKQQIKGSKIKFTVTDAITKHQYDYYENELQTLESIEKSLNRLESIDNSNPSEALECVDKLEQVIEEITISNADLRNTLKASVSLAIIKQSLLKAQKEHNSINLLMRELECKDFAELRKYARCGYEKLNSFKGSKEVKIEIPESSLMDYNPVKNCLKWEDLEFNHTPKIIDVKMNGNKYKLVVGYNVAGKNLAILRDGKKECYFLECDKQFFNDLHLERVEE